MRYDDLWKKGAPDILANLPPEKDKKAPKINFLYESMDAICRGLNAGGVVWVRLLQLQTMRPKDKYHILGNDWLARYGVGRTARNRAINAHERAGRIRTLRSDHRNIRVGLVPAQKRVAKARKCVGAAHIRADGGT
jgi:hypothetical protein